MFWKSENRHVNNLSCLSVCHDPSFKYKLTSIPKPYLFLWYWLMTKGFQQSTFRRPRCFMEKSETSQHFLKLPTAHKGQTEQLLWKYGSRTKRTSSECGRNLERSQCCLDCHGPLILAYEGAGILKRSPELNTWLRLFVSYRVITSSAR